MKKLLIPIIGLAVILASGCVVRSVYPFYTDKDLVFDPALVGDWVENDSPADSPEHWKIERFGEKAYSLTAYGHSDTNRYEAHLFRINHQSFLNLCPTNRSEESLPLHFLLKIDQIKPSLKIQSTNPEWLEKLVTNDPKAIRHIVIPDESGDGEKGRIVLTAETKELQAFMLKYADDTNAFIEITEFKRRKE